MQAARPCFCIKPTTHRRGTIGGREQSCGARPGKHPRIAELGGVAEPVDSAIHQSGNKPRAK